MKKHMACLTLALSMMIGGLTVCGSADSGTTGTPATPAPSTVSAAKEVNSQDIVWPEGSVQTTVGANAGGGIDTAARLTGEYMEKYAGRSFAVTNTIEGTGSIATNDVKNAKADGYVFPVTYEAILTNKIAGTTDFDYDAFVCAGTPSQVYTTCLLSKKYISVPELADAAKANPGTIKSGIEFAINDIVIIAMMEDNFGVSFQLVDAGVVSNQIASMMGNHIDFMKAPIGLAKDYVASRDFHILAFFNQEHSSDYPDVPTMKEEGVDFVVDKFFDCFFPEDTDPATIEKFSSALEQICQDPDFQKGATDVMCGADYIAPADMSAYFESCKTRLAEYQDPLEEHCSKQQY